MSNRERIMRIFSYLGENKGFAMAEELARFTGVSIRTIKNDIPDLKIFCEAAGARLIAVRGQGYRIEAVNESLFEEQLVEIQRLFSETYYSHEYENRDNDIARRLLAEASWVKLDDIEAEMYLSRSTIKNSIQSARRLLNQFHLSVISKPGKGIRVEGAEINRRYCMLELLIYHKTSTFTYLKSDKYLGFFETDPQQLTEIRHTMLAILRNSGRTIYDYNTHRIARYLSLMKNRYQAGFRIELPRSYQSILKRLSEFKISEDILHAETTLIPGIPLTESEIMGLEMLILIFEDPYEGHCAMDELPGAQASLHRMASKVFEGIKWYWGVDLNDCFRSKDYIPASLTSLYLLSLFQNIGYQKIGRDVENNEISATPMSVALARSGCEYLSRTEHVQCRSSDNLQLAIRLYSGLARVKFDYHKPRVLVASKAGVQACDVIVDRLNAYFGPDAFESLTPVGFYEVRGLNQSDYDYMILNYRGFTYRYALPFISVDCIPTNNQMEEIHEKVIRGSYQLNNILKKLNFSEDFVIRDFAYPGRELLITMLSYRHAQSTDKIEPLRQSLLACDDICVWNHMAFLIVNTENTGTNVFEIYSLCREGIWVRKDIQYVVFIAVNFGGDRKALKYMECVTHSLATDMKAVSRIVNKGTLSTLTDIVRETI